MGWMKTISRGMWGDEPQDVMDDALAKKLGRNWYSKTLPADKVARALNSILASKALRARIDKIYMRVWSRKATDKEYKGLIWGIKIR